MATPMAEQQLRMTADAAWTERWRFAWDMNNDGMVTISDVWLWLQWMFFAPGDFLLLMLMRRLTEVAVFFEVSPASIHGAASGIISAFLWGWIGLAIWANLSNEMEERRNRRRN